MPARLKIEQQLDGRWRLVRCYEARRSDDILGVFDTREKAQAAKEWHLNQAFPTFAIQHPNPWEDW